MKRIYYKKNKARRSLALFASYAAILLIALTFFLIKANERAETAERRLLTADEKILAALVEETGKMEEALEKCAYAATREMTAVLCSEIYTAASAARQSLSLSSAIIEMEGAEDIIKTSGEYAYTLARMTISGEDLSEDNRADLKNLSVLASRVAKSAQDFTPGTTKKLPAVPNLKGLSYNKNPRLLEGRGEITAEQAAGAAAAYLGLSNNNLRYDGANETIGDIPVYTFSTNRNGGLTIGVTKTGGYIANAYSIRIPQTAAISRDEAANIAARFLKDNGYPGMVKISSVSKNNAEEIVFAHNENGTICYPDTISVTIARDTGKLIAADSTDYIRNHHSRAIPKPEISKDAAIDVIGDRLSVQNTNMAIIKTSPFTETLCYELTCADAAGRTVKSFINAATAAEEYLLL